MNRFMLFAYFALGISMSGCASMQIEITRDPFARFPKSGTFAWMDDSNTLAEDPRVNRDEVDARIRGAVEKQMVARGYQLVSGGEPTVLVAYHAAIEGGLDAAAINDQYWSWGYGPDGAWGFGPNRRPGYESGPTYSQGSLILDIVDPESKRLLWRGSAAADIEVEATKEEKDRRVDEAVQRMLEQFP